MPTSRGGELLAVDVGVHERGDEVVAGLAEPVAPDPAHQRREVVAGPDDPQAAGQDVLRPGGAVAQQVRAGDAGVFGVGEPDQALAVPGHPGVVALGDAEHVADDLHR